MVSTKLHSKLTTILQHLDGQSVDLEKMASPPIQAIVFSPNGSPHIEPLKTPHTPISPPPDSTTSDLERQAAANNGDASKISSSVLHSDGDYFGQPNVHLLPAMTPDYWPSSHAWQQRVVLRMRGHHHLFFTRAEEADLVQNEHFDGLVSGDVVMLKFSDLANEDGTWSYENILPNATEERNAQYLAEVRSTSREWLPEVISVFKSAAKCRELERR